MVSSPRVSPPPSALQVSPASCWRVRQQPPDFWRHRTFDDFRATGSLAIGRRYWRGSRRGRSTIARQAGLNRAPFQRPPEASRLARTKKRIWRAARLQAMFFVSRQEATSSWKAPRGPLRRFLGEFAKRRTHPFDPEPQRPVGRDDREWNDHRAGLLASLVSWVANID